MKGWNWALIYRGSVVALLALILAQLAGVVDLRHDAARTWRAIWAEPRPEEEPAPMRPGQAGGLGSAYEEDAISALQQLPTASAPPGGFAGDPKR